VEKVEKEGGNGEKRKGVKGVMGGQRQIGERSGRKREKKGEGGCFGVP